MSEQSQIMNVKQAALYLNISTHWLYKLTSLKQIKYFKPSKKKIIFKKSDLDNFIFSNPVRTQKEVETQAADHIINNSK